MNPHIVATSASLSSSLGQRAMLINNSQESTGTGFPSPYSYNPDIDCGNKVIKSNTAPAHTVALFGQSIDPCAW